MAVDAGGYEIDEYGRRIHPVTGRPVGDNPPGPGDDYPLSPREQQEQDRRDRDREDYQRQQSYNLYLNVLRSAGQLAQTRRQYDPTAIEANIRNIIGY